MLLLREVQSFSYEEKDIEEDKDNGTIMVKGILQRADAENQNGRVYPFNILMREIENYKKLIREKRAFGCLDHEDSAIVNLQKLSHMIVDIWVEGSTVYGKVKVLDTPNGNIIKSIIKAGGVPGISSRALGSVTKKNGIDEVQDDLQIVCWDFVSEPSTHGAFMHLSEAKEIDPKIIKQIFTKSDRVDRVLNELLSLEGIK
jgi:hypothetical protein